MLDCCDVLETRSAAELGESLILHLATAHRVPIKWKNAYEEFKVRCSVYFAGEKLCDDVITQSRSRIAPGLQDTFIWDEWCVQQLDRTTLLHCSNFAIVVII